MGAVIGKGAISPIIIDAVKAASIGVITEGASWILFKVSGHTDTVIPDELIEEVWGTIGAIRWAYDIALIAFWVGTGITGIIDCILNAIFATAGLAVPSCQVEERITSSALPGHHVEDRWLGLAQSTAVIDCPWVEHGDAKAGGGIDSLIGELPAVLEATVAWYSLKSSDTHDKVIDKFDGYFEKASVEVGEPFAENNKILLWGLHIIGIENDLTEMNVGDQQVLVKGYVPLIMGYVENSRSYVELHWIASCGSDPKTSHEDNDVVATQRICKLSKLLPCCLRGIVDFVDVVRQTHAFTWYIHLNRITTTIFPAV